MAVNIIADVLKHKDEEIIEYITKTMDGIVKNYNTSLSNKTPEILWGNFGDIVMVDQVLRALDRRNNEKLAQMQGE